MQYVEVNDWAMWHPRNNLGISVEDNDRDNSKVNNNNHYHKTVYMLYWYQKQILRPNQQMQMT